jgi:hypothetical protein
VSSDPSTSKKEQEWGQGKEDEKGEGSEGLLEWGNLRPNGGGHKYPHLSEDMGDGLWCYLNRILATSHGSG